MLQQLSTAKIGENESLAGDENLHMTRESEPGSMMSLSRLALARTVTRCLGRVLSLPVASAASGEASETTRRLNAEEQAAAKLDAVVDGVLKSTAVHTGNSLGGIGANTIAYGGPGGIPPMADGLGSRSVAEPDLQDCASGTSTQAIEDSLDFIRELIDVEARGEGRGGRRLMDLQGDEIEAEAKRLLDRAEGDASRIRAAKRAEGDPLDDWVEPTIPQTNSDPVSARKHVVPETKLKEGAIASPAPELYPHAETAPRRPYKSPAPTPRHHQPAKLVEA